MSLGPIMVDLIGLTISAKERVILQQAMVGGVILFSRNYETPEQLMSLTTEIRAIRADLLIAIDHEGGRVQRCRDGFTRLPAVATLGEIYQQNPTHGIQQAERTGWLMAVELRAVGIDFSFAPVLDIDYGMNEVIGDRAFGTDPSTVTVLAEAYIRGMNKAGMAAVGKHFPGHGAVSVDSHIGLPYDARDYDTIFNADMRPFQQLCQQLTAIMPAHIVYERHDPLPACFSPFWLKTVLRERLGFSGAIISDDLSMAGAAIMGNSIDRTHAALSAGCDMVLVCNQPDAVEEVVTALSFEISQQQQQRLTALRGSAVISRAALLADAHWQQTVSLVTQG